MFIEKTNELIEYIDEGDRIFKSDIVNDGVYENAQFIRYKKHTNQWSMETRIGRTTIKLNLQEWQAMRFIKDFSDIITVEIKDYTLNNSTLEPE